MAKDLKISNHQTNKKMKTKLMIGMSMLVALVTLQSFIGINETGNENELAADEPLAKNWEVDGVHYSVQFAISPLVISEVEGSFKVYSGSIEGVGSDFSGASINFEVDVKSINTDNEMRDNHLKSADFFNSDQFPQMKFKSTSFKKTKGNKYVLVGDLTIRDVTKKVKFNVTHGGVAKDGYGNTKAGFKASTTINRFDYGLKWNGLTEAGGITVGEEVELDLKLQFVAK